MRIIVFIALFWPAVAVSQPLCPCLKCALGTSKSYWISSGSMKPALPVGSCVIARRLVKEDPVPAIGEIVVFRHPVSGAHHVFRLIAKAGQNVELRNGFLVLDGQPLVTEELPDLVEPFERKTETGGFPVCSNRPGVGQDCIAAQYRETLPDGTSYRVRQSRPSRLDTFGPTIVPGGHVFVLGDNRDNAMDSRVPQNVNGPGMIPVEALIGVVEEIRD
ncbi:signal peptidase I [Halovulum sp. GXIMD14793]